MKNSRIPSALVPDGEVVIGTPEPEAEDPLQELNPHTMIGTMSGVVCVDCDKKASNSSDLVDLPCEPTL